MAYANDLFNTGVFHPKTLEFTDINAARLEFVAGRIALYPEGFGQPWADFARRGLRSNPPQTFYPLPPFPAADGGTPQHYLGPGLHCRQRLEEGQSGPYSRDAADHGFSGVAVWERGGPADQLRPARTSTTRSTPVASSR